MNHNRIFSLLSLCKKAGLLVSGELACEKSLQRGDAVLVIIATDASNNTIKKFTNKAFYYEVPVVSFGEKDRLGASIGKESRTVLIITDENLGAKVKGLIEEASVEI